MEIWASCIWCGVVAWLILRAFRQRDLLPPVAAAQPPADGAPSVAVIVPAIIVACAEAMQIYLPGRTVETTDPLLVMLLGFALKVLAAQPVNARRHRV